jgi:hypothetical protein
VLKRELRKKYWQGQETIRPEFGEPGRKSKAAKTEGGSGGSD